MSQKPTSTDPAPLAKTYDPKNFETHHYQEWIASNLHKASEETSDTRPCFSTLMPPPNVTGILHVGHALVGSLQDTLCRYKRAKGFNVLWLPGMDHAGIATQMVVENLLEKEGKNRKTLGRKAFEERIWEWKEHSGGTILKQMEALGFLPDWSRQRFTMDDGMVSAVTKTFTTLYQQGLIYRAERLVNWDTRLLTAISDLEVENKEVKGSMWYFRYPLADQDGYIVIGTTRPETMFGDVAVAVHPEDTRYQHLIGKNVRLPLCDRLIPIIADIHADPEKGSGAVKITPAHDFNDFEVGKRAGLSPRSIMTEEGTLTHDCPKDFQGKDRFAARKDVVKQMEALGLLEKIEDTAIMVPYGDRSGTIIEPRLTLQWFVDAPTMAKAALEAAEKDFVSFVPKGWMNTYRHWMTNIQPWCISRQLWWGHRIPVWYAPDGTFFVAETEEEAQQQAFAHFKEKNIPLTQEEDVLDTWFSSALWPFATMGDWGTPSPLLEKFYPTDILVTGFDIIFFWVARMMMFSLHFQGEEGKQLTQVPFRKIYINALIRDAKGQKMSKSKGNALDPLDLVHKFGADALRLTLVALAGQDRDIRLSEDRIEGYRNFITKLWNSARFCQMHQATNSFLHYDPQTAVHPLNRWILTLWRQTLVDAEKEIESGRLNEGALKLYRFIWGIFCDWYIEFAKPLLEDPQTQEETRAVMGGLFASLLAACHPFIPFVTENLWQTFGDGHKLLAQGIDPFDERFPEDQQSLKEGTWLLDLIHAIRAVRAEVSLSPKIKPVANLISTDPQAINYLKRYEVLICRLGRLESISLISTPPKKGVLTGIVDDQTDIFVHVGSLIDIAAEQGRLKKEKERLQKDFQSLSGRLNNKNFIEKAPPEVVKTDQARLESLEEQLKKTEAAFERLATL